MILKMVDVIAIFSPKVKIEVKRCAAASPKLGK